MKQLQDDEEPKGGGGWCNKAAVLVHQNMKGHTELMQELLNRWATHPSLIHVINKIEKLYQSVGTKAYKRFNWDKKCDQWQVKKKE